MTKYDLDVLGYKYKGVASVPNREVKFGPWTIIDVPQDVEDATAKKEVGNVLERICAFELPTSLECNLRCQYCYIGDPRMKNIKVTVDQVTKILDSIKEMFPVFQEGYKNKQGKDEVFFSPWGAEPFVNIDTMDAIRLWSKENIKQKFSIHTSTNGTIWNKKVEQFFIDMINDKCMPDLQISLDGPPHIQNKFRPFVNGKGSFKAVENFVTSYVKLHKDMNLTGRNHHFCSTIHLKDPAFADNWADAAMFFSEPNKWWTTLPYLPMRVSGEDMANENDIRKFVDAQKRVLEVITKRNSQGITVVDNYTNLLFGTYQIRSKNAFPYCSALSTQIAVDIDGSIYPCHGGITSPEFKPFLWFGNLFDKTISYRLLKRNLNYQFGGWTNVKCNDCPVYKYATGSACHSCAPHNLAVTGEPTTDNILKCMAFGESFKYWVEIAKKNIEGNPVLDTIPHGEYFSCDKEITIEAPNKIKFKVPNGCHFDMNYDGHIDKGAHILGLNTPENTKYIDTWWKFDDFYQTTLKEK